MKDLEARLQAVVAPVVLQVDGLGRGCCSDYSNSGLEGLEDR